MRFCEKGGDVGGTWYWNRYPGIACDVESYSYFPLLEEMGYFPTMKFASGFEIFEYCQKMAEKFDFYDHCLFHTTVEKTVWDEDTGRWTVYTDRGDAMRARFVILANGILTTPEAGPYRRHGDVPGRVVPHVALELQRRSGRQAGRHHRHRRHRGAGHSGAGQGRRRAVRLPAHAVDDRRARPARHDAGGDRGVVGTSRAGRGPAGRGSPGSPTAAPPSRPTTTTSLAGSPTSGSARSTTARLTPEELVQKQLNTNFRIMEQIRARVDAIVEDPKTAAALKPYYPYGCKRPTFHDEYLPTFNRPTCTSSTPHRWA